MASAETIQAIKNSYSNFVFKFGKKIGVGITPLIVYSGSTPYKGWFTAPKNIIAVSSSIEDAVGQGGATEITIVGQDVNGEEITDDIVLTGTTPSAPSTKQFRIVYRAYIKTTEDNDPVTGPNHGAITMYESGVPANIAAIVDATIGQTLMCIYRIPSNKYGELKSLNLTAPEGKSAFLTAKTRESLTSPWLTKGTFSVFANSVSQQRIKPGFIAPGTDIVLLVYSSAAGTDIDANFEIELKDLPEENN